MSTSEGGVRCGGAGSSSLFLSFSVFFELVMNTAVSGISNYCYSSSHSSSITVVL